MILYGSDVALVFTLIYTNPCKSIHTERKQNFSSMFVIYSLIFLPAAREGYFPRRLSVQGGGGRVSLVPCPFWRRVEYLWSHIPSGVGVRVSGGG